MAWLFFAAAIGAWMSLSGCASLKRQRPCTDGGQPALEKPTGGTRQCMQQKLADGRFINHGRYVEFWPNGSRAIAGDYKFGRKQGWWTEWDENGVKVADKFYEEGVEVTTDHSFDHKKGDPAALIPTEPPKQSAKK